MSESTLRVIVRIKARPDKIDEARTVLVDVVDPSRREPGCISYNLLQSRDTPSDFAFASEWKDDYALRNHIASHHIRGIGLKLKGMVAEPPDITVYTVVS
jgi:quinol monooxygenase YgiN